MASPRLAHALVVLLGALVWANPGTASAAEKLLLGRYTQGTIEYTGHEVDAGFNGTATSTIDAVSFEARFRPEKTDATRFFLSTTLRFEILRQFVLGKTFVQPRSQGQLEANLNLSAHGGFRLAPIFSVGLERSTVFRITGPDTAPSSSVRRFSYGGGGRLTMKIRTKHPFTGKVADSIEFGGSILMRVDGGGCASGFPSALKSTAGSETEIGVTLFFGTRVSLEGRYRLNMSQYEWTPAVGGAEDSTLKTLETLLDFGLGIRF